MTTMSGFKLKIIVQIVLVLFSFHSGLINAQSLVSDETGQINSQIRTFLESHCISQNNTLESHEFVSVFPQTFFLCGW